MLRIAATPTSLRLRKRTATGTSVPRLTSSTSHGGRTVGYPRPKLVLNRVANMLIRIAFGLRFDDVTNAFKLYSRDAIEGMKPFLSHHFNLTVELPLKAIVRGYSYAVVPNYWINRKVGVSKLRIQEMGSRYLFIVIYCFIEKWLSKKDYHRERLASAAAPAGDAAEAEDLGGRLAS